MRHLHLLLRVQILNQICHLVLHLDLFQGSLAYNSRLYLPYYRLLLLYRHHQWPSSTQRHQRLFSSSRIPSRRQVPLRATQCWHNTTHPTLPPHQPPTPTIHTTPTHGWLCWVEPCFHRATIHTGSNTYCSSRTVVNCSLNCRCLALC